jgi:hypothetical protein
MGSHASVVSLQTPTLHWSSADEQSVGPPPQTPAVQKSAVVQN